MIDEMKEKAKYAVNKIAEVIGDGAEVENSNAFSGIVYVDYTGENWALYFTVEGDGDVSFDIDFTADGPVDLSKLGRFVDLLRAIDAFNAAAD